uniref:receptor protein serine/threonine kinase n=1 Tax=Pygocentrus nattereri TaxID=42514 RepID=A0A3B4DMF1_PYGNA
MASPRNSEKAQRVGNVSEVVQHCTRTECCVGIFRMEHGQPRPDLLGCSMMDTSCPESSCHAFMQDQYYVRCVCNSDLCNFNITLNYQVNQTQHSHTSDLLNSGILVILVGALIILFSLVTAVKWKCLLKGYGKVVACGHFACVWQGSSQGLSVALKVFPATQRQEFDKEKDVYMLPFMMHSGIARFLGAGRMGREFVLVLELANQGSLNAFLSRTVCDWASAVKLAQTLSEGLAYLHTDLNKNGVYKPAIAHCDLSSRNVLVRADGSCALCDFGCSVVLQCFGKSQALKVHSGAAEVGSFHPCHLKGKQHKIMMHPSILI